MAVSLKRRSRVSAWPQKGDESIVERKDEAEQKMENEGESPVSGKDIAEILEDKGRADITVRIETGREKLNFVTDVTISKHVPCASHLLDLPAPCE